MSADPSTLEDHSGAYSLTSDTRLVLVVEDDPTNRRVIGAMLRRLGYQCDMATNGREAVEAVERTAYSAVLMDCLMPVMDGYEATRSIREHESAAQQTGSERRVPIIAVTALAFQGARDRCLSVGMDDYLTKPVMVETLTEILERWTKVAEEPSGWCADQPPQSANDDDAAPIALEIIDELRGMGDDLGQSLIVELVQDFGTEIPDRFPTIHAAITDGQTELLLRELHFIAGCAAIVGARHVERLARSVDDRHGPVDLHAASDTVRSLEAEYVRAYDQLQVIAGLA